MKKLLLSISIAAVLALTLIMPAAGAEADPVRIKVDGSTGAEFEVTGDQNVVIYWRWGVCSRGQAQAFLQAVNQNYHELDGEALFTSVAEANQYWGPIQPFGNGEGCIGNKTTYWATLWEYDLGQLAPGTYELHSIAAVAHRLTDGFDGDGDGRPDFYSGTLFDQYITINVVEASE